MTQAIIKYTPNELANLNGQELSLSVDKYIVGLFERLEGNARKLDQAEKALRECSDNEPGVKAFATKVYRETKHEVAETTREINKYVGAQRELFASRGMDPDRAYTWAIVQIEEDDPLTGKLGKCRLVERRTPFDAAPIDDDEDRSVRATLRLPSEDVMIKEHRRGKYHDGDSLIEQTLCSIDPSERYCGD